MATKPGNLAEWATGESAPVTEPLLAEKQAGWPVAYKPPAQWFNWWMKTVHLWMIWLDAFESEAHTWTAAQTYSAGVTVTKSGTTIADAAGRFTGPNGAGAAAVYGTAGSGASGIGGRFVSAAASGIGVLGDGVLTGGSFAGDAYGVYAEGGTLPGVYGFSASNHGLEGHGATSSGNAHGVLGVGGGTGNAGAGVYGLGGANAPGVVGVGSGNGGSGNGGNFYNSATAADGTAAANFISQNNSGPGGWGVGSGTGAGLIGEAENAPGVWAYRQSGPTDLSAAKVDGSIDMTGAVQPPMSTGARNLITKNCFPKAMLLLKFNGTLAPDILWGQNIAVAAQTNTGSAPDLSVDFVQAFSGTPGIVAHAQDLAGGFDVDAVPVVVGGNGFVMRFVFAKDNIQLTTSDLQHRTFLILVYGAMT